MNRPLLYCNGEASFLPFERDLKRASFHRPPQLFGRMVIEKVP